MAAWDEGDYQGALDELNILKVYVRQCDSDTPRQSLKVKEHIDYLLDHSDQEPDDMKRDRDLSKELKDSAELFAKYCSCKKR